MPPPGQGGSSDQNQGLDLIWGIVFVVLVVLALWYFARGPILQALFYVKLFEIKLISYFTDSLEPTRAALSAAIHAPTLVSVQQVGLWFQEIGRPLRLVFAIPLLCLAAIIFLTHPTLKFNNIFDMKRLRESEKDNWPQITPILKEDLLNDDIDNGKWAMSPSPMQFAKKYKLIEEIPQEDKKRPYLKKKPEVRILKDRAEQVFTKQLGPVWRGVEKAPIHARALLAIFAAHSNHDKESVSLLTAQIARSSAGDTLDFSNVDKILKKHYHSKALQQAMHSHAYLYGVLASLLEASRTGGVLSSSDFIWLKPLDRPMWYVVNTVGRRTCMSEIAGFVSHWLAEKALGRKLTQPMVKNAVKGLELAIKDIIYVPDEGAPVKGS